MDLFQQDVELHKNFWQHIFKLKTLKKLFLNVIQRMHEQKNHPRLIEYFCS